jgi:histidinol-phosphate aminotransferase
MEDPKMKSGNTSIITSKRVQKYLKLKNTISERSNESQSDDIVYLDKNENPYFPSFDRLLPSKFQKLITKYPDPMSRVFLSQVSKEIGYPISFIMAGAGSDELLDLICRTFLDCKDRILSVKPTFSMYRKYAEINGASYLSYPLNLKINRSTGIATYSLNEIDFLEQAKSSRILILARPNNPDGNVVSKNFIEKLLNLNILTIIDEAYIEFSEVSSTLDLISKYDNLIILRTLSKSHALAGIRLGYAVANPSIIEVLKKVKSPYNVNVFAAQLGSLVIGSAEILENIMKIKNSRDLMVQKLLNLRMSTKQFYIHLSQGNFILIRFLNSQITNSIYQFLLNSQIKVRKFGNELPNCIRISIGTKSQMEKLLKSFKTYFEGN